MNEIQPTKPPRTYEYEKGAQFQVEEKEDSSTIVSKLTITLGSSRTETNKLSVVPGKSTVASPRKSPLKSSSDCRMGTGTPVIQKPTSPVKSFTETVKYTPGAPKDDLNESIAGKPVHEPTVI